jgi:hypothetical protein
MGQSATTNRTGRRDRLWRVAALILTLLVVNIGCDPIQMMNFIATPFADTMIDPVCPLTIDGKESTVVIITTHDDIEDSVSFRGVNDMLTRQLIGLLEARFKEHKDKVKIVPFTKVQAYVNKHPDWVTQSKREIGKHFNADYVLFLEMGPMSMYEKGSNSLLFRGNVEIHIAVVDVNQDEGEGPKYEKDFSCTYPLHGPEDAGGGNSATQFRSRFLEHIAKDLLVEFAPYETRNKIED